MNRHERRAAEARARSASGSDPGFRQFEALYRQAFKKADEREIGESFMRGEAAEANGVKAMIIHPPGEAPPSRDECDVEVSAAYGPQRFAACMKAELVTTLKERWPVFMNEAHKIEGNPLTDDMRHDTRAFIFKMLMTNRPFSSGEMAAITAGAIVWLAATSPAGSVIGDSHKSIHYEITDTGVAPDGRRTRNYRLMLT